MRLKSGDKAGFQDFSQIGWTDPVFCGKIKRKSGHLTESSKSLASKAVGLIVKRNITVVAGGEKSVSSTDMRRVTVELFSTCQTL